MKLKTCVKCKKEIPKNGVAYFMEQQLVQDGRFFSFFGKKLVMCSECVGELDDD